MVDFNDLKKKIISDDKTALAIEYIFSKAIKEGLSHNLKFIYKKHKIIRDKKGFYSIYRLEDKVKIYGKIKWQDVAKYIIDNLNNVSKIQYIYKVQDDILRYQDKIDFLKSQYIRLKDKQDIIHSKIQADYIQYNALKRELFRIIGKNKIC